MLDHHPLSLGHSHVLEKAVHPDLEFSSLLFTAICAAILLFIHWGIPRFKKLNIIDNAILNSITGGVALGYILLHLLPDLILSVDDLREETHSNFLGTEKNLTFVIFLFVLLGFLTLYILEKIAHDKTKNNQEASQVTYLAHIGTLTYLNFVIALMLPATAADSLSSLLIFTFIMGFHFALQDHSMQHHFPERFNEWGRYIIMTGVVVGWLVGVFLLPHAHTIPATLMTAFLAGALILATVKIEFSLFEGHSHFPTFIASLSLEAAIAFIVLLLETVG